MQGNGSAYNPWQIYNAAELHALALFVNYSKENSNATRGVHYRLMMNIDLRSFLSRPEHIQNGWEPIGRGLDIFGNERYAFQGHFNGGGHVIMNLGIRRAPGNRDTIANYFNGLFGVIENATIDSLGVELRNDSITGANFTGILVGQAYWNSRITHTYVKGNVAGQMHTGGMVGFLSGSTIRNCYAVTNVRGTSKYTGGLVGTVYFGDTIEYAYSTGNYVEGYLGLGGLVGKVRHQTATIRNTVADQIRLGGKQNIGAMIGEIFAINPSAPNVVNSYVNRTVVIPSGTTGHHQGTDSRERSVFVTEQFYINAANWTGGAWDFYRVWIMPPNGHPVFRWQDLDLEPDIDPIVFVDEILIERNPNNIFEASIACDEDHVNVRIEVGMEETVFIGTNNMQNNIEGKTFWWFLPDYGDNYLPFIVKTPGGKTQTDTILINKPIPFQKVTRVYWNNTLIVVNNPENNGGFKFTSYKWFRNDELTPFNTEQWWTIDNQGERPLGATNIYRLELTAQGVSGILHTCQSDNIFLGPIRIETHPNPVTQGGVLYVENDIEENLLKDAVIRVFNINGQLVETIPARQQNIINIRYGRGVYILVLEGKDGLRRETKIIVK
jgi:hypothetical protein